MVNDFTNHPSSTELMAGNAGDEPTDQHQAKPPAAQELVLCELTESNGLSLA